MNTSAIVTRMDGSNLPVYGHQNSGIASIETGGAPPHHARIWPIVARYWWIVPLVWALVAIPATYLIYTRVPPKYVARGYVLISPTRTVALDNREVQSPFYLEHLKTQAEIMHSPQLLREAAESPELSNYPFFRSLPDQTNYLYENVTVTPSNQMVNVTVVHENADFAKDVVNAVLARYAKVAEDLEKKRTAEMTTWLDTLGNQTQDLIESYQKKLRNLMNSETVITSDDERKVFTEAAAKAKNALLELSNSRLGLQGAVEAIKARKLPEEELFKKSIPVDGDPELVNWRSELNRVTIADGILESKGATTKHPDRVEFRKQMKKLREQIDTRTAKIRNDAWDRELASQNMARDQQLEKLQSDLAAAETQMTELATQVDKNESAAKAMKSVAFDMEQLRDKITENKEIVKRAMDRKKEIDSMTAAPGRMGEAKRADRPATATVDTRPKLAVAANGGALLLGCLILVILVKLRNTIGSTEDLPESYQPLIVGTVSNAGSAAGSLQGKMRRKILGEEMRLVHANLLPPGPNERRIMMVTSPTPSNGKTSIASHLALSLAKSGMEVLLIDADLRKRDLTTMFDVGFRPGLAELLQGKAPELVRPVELLPNLRLMGAGGKLERNPVELFQRMNFRECIGLLQDKFDCIIVDTPPTLVVADARLIARSCDEVLCVVRAQMTSQKDIDQTIDALSRITGKAPKLIVNGVEHRQSYYKYKFSYTSEGDEDEVTKRPATSETMD